MNIRRPVPLWALLLAILVSGAVAAALLYLPRPPGPDFNLTLSSNPVLEQPNNWSISNVKIESVRGYVGVVSFGIIDPSGLRIELTQDSDLGSLAQNQLVHGAIGNTTFHVLATGIGDHSVRIVATGGPISHYVDLVVRVWDVRMTSNATSLTIARGNSGTVGISLTSLNGLSGDITLQGSVCLPQSNGCYADTNVSLQFAPGNVILQSGGSATAILTVSVSSSDTQTRDYIVVTAHKNAWWFGSPIIHLKIV